MKIAAATQVDQLADMLADLSVRLAAIEKVGHVHDVGVIEMYGQGTVPPTHLECVGGTVLIADYPVYFARVGTLWGGNGSTTVGLPDFRGRAPQGRGTGDAAGATAQALGTKYGEQTHTLTGAESGTTAHGHGHGLGTNDVDTNHYHTLANLGMNWESANHYHGPSGDNFMWAQAAAGQQVQMYLGGANPGPYIQWGTQTGGISANHNHTFYGRIDTQAETGYANYHHSHTVTGTVSNSAAANAASALSLLSPRTTIVLAIRVKL